MPYTQEWNLSFEREMPCSSKMRASDTGNRGIGLLRFALDNLPSIDPNNVLVANHPNDAPAVLYMAANRPSGDPRAVVFTTNTAVSNGAWSYYHGLQLEWTKRLSHNLNFQSSYTWSKAIDTTSEATAVGAGDTNQTGNNARTARALSRFHTPHRLTFYATYRLPWFQKERGIVGQLLGGWQFSTVVKLSKGTPFTVFTTALDLNLDSFGESRPVLLDPSVLGRSINDPATSQQQLPRTAFRTLTTSDFNTSTLGRNTFFTDGVQNVDMAFYKSFNMPWENHRFTLRADFFNAFNHVQYGFPATDITAANFGAITGTATQYVPRTVQVSMRYAF